MANQPTPGRARTMYGGHMGLAWRNLLRLHARNTLPAWYGNPNIIYFHKARAAIRYVSQLLDIHPGNKILIPSYNCGVEVDPLLKSGASVSMFRQDRTGRIDVDDIERKIDADTRVIYVNQYFGFPQPLERIRRLCDERGIYLIEDCALSLLSKDNHGVPLGSTGDLAFFNLYKTLPLPDGGALMINNPKLVRDNLTMLAPPRLDVLIETLKLCKNSLLRQLPAANALYGSIKRRKNRNIQDDGPSAESRQTFPDMPASYYYDEHLNLRRMSRLSHHLLERLDFEQVVQQRRTNFLQYLQCLAGTKHIEFLYHDLPEGVCPLSFPIFVDNPDLISRKLYQHAIVALHWWHGYHRALPPTDFDEACKLKDHLLVLPVHQQLNDQHIDYIIRSLRRVIDD
ncbi:MAG: aminotransferase class V-fold PLP-dependent enzyme [Phycisphaeraceae bacterium]|nr:aminotransferase class V-fold PLP-dependent enzyme [Phycisphaeraceae bacterium]